MNKVWEPCVNSSTNRKCCYFTITENRKRDGLKCSKNGYCRPKDVSKCNHYEPSGAVEYL